MCLNDKCAYTKDRILYGIHVRILNLDGYQYLKFFGRLLTLGRNQLFMVYYDHKMMIVIIVILIVKS